MKLIKPHLEILEQQPGIDGIYKMIELAGRTCYRSKDKITEDSAKPFIDKLIKSGHLSVLEHGTVYLKVPNEELLRNFIDDIPSNFNYSWCRTNPVMDEDNNVYITTNYRHIIEHKLEDYLKYLCEPTEFHEKRITTYFISDIHFYKDITRHRHMSFSIESTRYCNYSKDRWGNEINFAIPVWLKEEEELEFEEDLKVLEQLYFKWINKGWQPQQAAYFLAQGTKAEIVMTGFISDYKHFFDLRALGTTGKPHPTVVELAEPLRQEFIKRGYINDGVREENL